MAYPVRYDGSNVNIAKNSMGLNLRIYSLSNLVISGAGIQTTNPVRSITWKDFDVWREIFYYEYIRDTIMKRNISPNFITLFFYAKDELSKIDYSQLNTIIQNHTNPNWLNLQLNNQGTAFTNNINVTQELATLFNTSQQNFQPTVLTNYSETLLVVTEAPTSSLMAVLSTI